MRFQLPKDEGADRERKTGEVQCWRSLFFKLFFMRRVSQRIVEPDNRNGSSISNPFTEISQKRKQEQEKNKEGVRNGKVQI